MPKSRSPNATFRDADQFEFNSNALRFFPVGYECDQIPAPFATPCLLGRQCRDFWNQRIRFSVKDRYDRPIFWSTRREDILADLTKMDLKVNSDPLRLNWINPDDS